jgi:hypothetical protein
MLSIMKLLLLLVASAKCAHATATLSPELLASLSHVGLENPGSLAKALDTIELRSLQDIQMLDNGERAEMFASLQAMEVGLGSRAKLQWLAFGCNHAVSFRRNGKDAHGILDQRQLQESNGERDSKGEDVDPPSVSSDTIALMMTALLAIGSFMIQAKAAKDADTTQRDIERAQQESARVEAKATLLLERVRSQLADALYPMLANEVIYESALLSLIRRRQGQLHRSLQPYRIGGTPKPL